jgi:hypothetical protein
MGLELIPRDLRERFTFAEYEHACAILRADFPEQFKDILDCMRAFTLKKSYIIEQGGGRSPVSFVLDGFLSGIDEKKQAEKATRKTKHRHSIIQPIGPSAGRGWHEKKFEIKIDVDGCPIPIPTHKIDNFKQLVKQPRGVGVEVEWNNKDPFYDRDLNNFRLLRQLNVLSVGVIITRLSELQGIFDDLGKGQSYGAATTHWDKLIPKVEGGGASGCPLLLIGLGKACYDASS